MLLKENYVDLHDNEQLPCPERHCTENGKISHRLGDNICRRLTWQETVVQSVRRTLKLGNEKTNNVIK